MLNYTEAQLTEVKQELNGRPISDLEFLVIARSAVILAVMQTNVC